MYPNAVTIAVIVSLFLLLSNARHLTPSTDGFVTVNLGDLNPSNKKINDADLSRQIAHSFRLPLDRHVSRHVGIEPVEIPYGDDMVGLPPKYKNNNNFKNGFKGVEDKNMKKRLDWISKFLN